MAAQFRCLPVFLRFSGMAMSPEFGEALYDARERLPTLRAGIIDPTKVVRIALENAVSVASVLLLTEATMTEIPDVKKERSLEPEMAM